MKHFFTLFNQYRGLSRSAYVIFFARMITNMGAFIWPMLTLILSQKLGYDNQSIAFYTVGVMLLYIPAQLLGGRLADKFDNKKLIIIFDLISVALFIACGFVGINNTMLYLFIAAGLFASMEGPSFEALVAKSTKPKERDRVMSLHYFGMNLGLVLGASVGGFLFKDHLSLAFIIDGLTTLTSTLLIIAFVEVIDVEQLEAHEKNEYETVREGLSVIDYFKSNPTILMYIIISIFGAFVYNQWTYLIPIHLGALYGEDSGVLVGFLTSTNAMIVVLFTPLLTYVVRKLFELGKIVIGTALITISYLLLAFSDLLPMFFIMIFFFTLGEIINSIGGAPFVSRRVPDSHRGRIGSIMGLASLVGMLLGRVVVGFLLDKIGHTSIYLLTTLISAVNVAIVYKTRQMDKHSYPLLYLDVEGNENK